MTHHSRSLLPFLVMLLGISLASRAEADPLFKCVNPQTGDVLYTNYQAGPNCRTVGGHFSSIPRMEPTSMPEASAPSEPQTADAPPRVNQVPLTPLTSFEPVTIQFPAVAVYEQTPEMKKLLISRIKQSAFAIEAITLTYHPERSPETGPSMRFDPVLGQINHLVLQISTTVIQKALNVDLTHADVYLHVPRATPLPQNYIQGPSASGILTVAIAAAILGDPLPSDACMTGTMEPDGRVGPVGGIEEKILACKDYKGTRFIIPAGFTTPELIRRSVDTGIQIVEAHTLAEAYEAIIGRPLRPYAGVQPRL